MTRRDDAGGILEGDGIEDTTVDEEGTTPGTPVTSTGAAFASAPRPPKRPVGARWTSCSPRKSPTLSRTPPGDLTAATVGPAVSWLSWSAAATDHTRGPIRTSLGWTAGRPACRLKRQHCT
jgi:hypothetical protein